ncbi:MAG: transglycosylase SLT domain-containing protein [Chitinivibrionales bacterium]|nr:transglycosylase SLT domain-containing protein [Chitinivibrionales bacterium]
MRKSSTYYRTITLFQKNTGIQCRVEFVPENMETEEILAGVSDGTYEATISDDYIARMQLMYLQNLAIAFPVSDTQHIAWAVRKSSKQLRDSINAFFTNTSYKPRGLHSNMLYNKYFKSHTRIAQARSSERADTHGKISSYDKIMKKYSRKYDLDWRMVAAQTYQESKFNPDARSWVGAVGLMQIMPATGNELRVGDITRPKPNVHGGTKYMRQLIERFDKGIPFQDRYHFALASYNAGYGHVIDARRLAADLNLDNTVWFENVEQAMLLLAKPEYARKARYGYCRGKEPVTYVANIRRLYNHYSQLVE